MTHVSLSLPAGTLDLSVVIGGDSQPVLLLHGGAGPTSMRPFFDALSDFRLILPTHPGFDGTIRPDWMRSIADLAECYISLIEAEGLKDVVVIGNSVGGWIAAEMAARRMTELAGIILINPVGLKPDEHTGPIIDPSTLSLPDLLNLSFADPSKARRPNGEAAAHRAANQLALTTYAGNPFMHDPSLLSRLNRIMVPCLVLSGQQDGIVTPAYGRRYARQIPNARFATLENAGHLPQIEQLDSTAFAVRAFMATLV